MKISRLLVIVLLLVNTPPVHLLAASSSEPQKVAAYLKDENNFLTEDGLLPFNNPETGEFANYVYNNWRTILANFDQIAPEPREQCLIVASAEILSPEDYVQFVSELSDLRAEGRAAPQAIWTALWAGMNKNDFLAYNYDRPEVAALIDKLQAIMVKENAKQWMEFFKEIKSGQLKQNVIQRRKQDGDSMPEAFTGPIKQVEKTTSSGTPGSVASSGLNITPSPSLQAPPFQSPGAHPLKQIFPWSIGVLVLLAVGLGLYIRSRK